MKAEDIEILKIYSQKDESLRDYQKDNKQKIYDAWCRTNSVMLQMPTGTGKTRLFVSIIRDIFEYSRDNKIALKVLVLVHRTELIDQIDEELGFKYNLAHGIIQSGERERKIYPIQLASVQTLTRRINDWADKKFDFIIVDEAHHIKADSYQKIIKTYPDAKLLGVTATPVRLNGSGFTDTFDELIISPSVRKFIEDGYLSQYDYYSVGRSSFIQKEIDGIKKFSQGDYAESELERICDNDRIRAQVVKAYLEFANGKKGIVYTINKLHNNNLCKEFIAEGISAVAIDCDTPRDIRERYIRKFRNGEIKIICNVNLFTEGFDCPDIEFVQLARPTKSLALYLQQVGRGLRISEGKEKALFLDNVGLYNRFGFPSSKRMWQHHFEGKYSGNKSEEEVEGPHKISADEITKRERHQSLAEGKERVHLIQSTDEKNYYDQRKATFITWLDKYVDIEVKAMNYAFNKIRIDGLGLHVDFFYKRHGRLSFSDIFHLYIKEETKALKEYLDAEEFYFFQFEGNIIIHKEYRKCKDFDELIEKLDFKFHQLRENYVKDTVKEMMHQYKEFNFSEAELYDIIYEIVDDRLAYKQNSACYDEDKVKLFIFIIALWHDTFSIGKRNKKYDWLYKTTIEAIYNHNNSNP